MAYLPDAAINEFIWRAGDRGLTHMQLQKLVYLAHEEWLKKHDTPFLSENPQVWQFGPVFARVYHELKHYKKNAIKDQIILFDERPRIDESQEDILSTIDQIWDKHKGHSGVYLSDLTHMPGTAWRKIAQKFDFKVPSGLEIKPEDIISAVR